MGWAVVEVGLRLIEDSTAMWYVLLCKALKCALDSQGTAARSESSAPRERSQFCSTT